MASRYMVDESLGFCTEYFALYQHTKRRIWDPEQELKDTVLSNLQRNQIHEYVLNHSVHMAELLR
jgi:hypothetical protein